MTLPSTAWSARISRGALAAVVLCGQAANAQPPAPNGGCANGPGDSCVTHEETYGWYPTRWRRWPESPKTLEPAPAKKTVAADKKTGKSDDKSSKPPADRPPIDESLPDRPQTPPPQSGIDGDLPPKPPRPSPDALMEPESFAPVAPLTEPSRDDSPRSEVPDESAPPPPKPPKFTTPKPTAPEMAPAMSPDADLPQPSLDDDLLKVLPKEKSPSSRGKPKPKTPDTKPPTKSRVKEDPFIDDPPAPGEMPPAEPREGHRQPAASEGESRLGGAGPNHLRWGTDEAEAVRAAIPTAMFRAESSATTAPQSTIEITAAHSAERPTTNALREAIVQRDVNASPAGRANPLRRGSPSKFLSVDAGPADQLPQTGETAAGSSIANPLR